MIGSFLFVEIKVGFMIRFSWGICVIFKRMCEKFVLPLFPYSPCKRSKKKPKKPQTTCTPPVNQPQVGWLPSFCPLHSNCSGKGVILRGSATHLTLLYISTVKQWLEWYSQKSGMYRGTDVCCNSYFGAKVFLVRLSLLTSNNILRNSP